MKMNTLTALAVAALAFPGCSDGGMKAVKPQYRTDRSPLLKRFPFLGEFKMCLWEGGVAVDRSKGLVPAPSSLFIRGFVQLRPQDKQILLNTYKWENTSGSMFPSNPPPASGFPIVSGAILRSGELMSSLTSMTTYRKGTILIAPESDMLYLDLRQD